MRHVLGIIQGFSVILGMIGAGYITAAAGIVKGEQRMTLNNVAFYIATPALLFDVLHQSTPSILLSPVILLTTASALIAAAVYIVASRLWFKRDLASTTLGAAGAGYLNANNLGLPIAVYILGDAAYVAPLMLVQLLVFSPVILSILDASRGRSGGALRAIGRATSNPIIIASALGLVVALTRLPIPALIMEPISMIGAAAIPLALLSFGISLRGQPMLQAGSGRQATFTATAIKVIVMPLITWLLALAFGLTPHETFVAVTIAALPTAQNIYIFAATYQRAEVLVRDTVFLTTFTSLPVIAVIAMLFA